MLAATAAAHQQARDLPQIGRGTASLAGTVVSDDSEPRPLRRVRVTLHGSDAEVDRTTITDDAGGFEFTGLPAGRYTVSGTKEGYVTASHGSRRPGRPGTPVVLRDRQTLQGVAIRLPRGAVMTGILFDVDGDPLPGARVRVLRYAYVGGERRLSPVHEGAANQVTDDRGVYRIYGLAEGEYAIATPGRQTGPGDRDVVRMTESEIRRGLQELKQTTRTPAPPSDETASHALANPDAPRVGYAPVYYPGTTVASQAAMIKVGPGEERRELDFQMQLVPVTTVRGTVVGSERTYSDYTRVHLVATGVPVLTGSGEEGRTAPIARDGRFAFPNVPPGQYTIAARGVQRPGSTALASWASTEIVVDGQLEQDVMLALQPALALSGRIVFEGAAAAPGLTSVRVALDPVLAGGQVALAAPPASVNAAGRFSIDGIAAGRYRLEARVAGHPEWTAKSLVIDGREALDAPLDLRTRVDGAVLTLSSRPSELSGTLRDASGRALAGHAVVVFPADRALWAAGPRRIRHAASARDGTYQFRNLTAGRYAIASLPDVEDGEWLDGAFLERIADAALELTLAEGEKKSLGLVIRAAGDR